MKRSVMTGEEMKKAEHRVVLRDLLSGRSVKGLGDVNRPRGTSRRRRVQVYDPDVKFISLASSLHLRSLGSR